jgi:hypothetical protein
MLCSPCQLLNAGFLFVDPEDGENMFP